MIKENKESNPDSKVLEEDDDIGEDEFSEKKWN